MIDDASQKGQTPSELRDAIAGLSQADLLRLREVARTLMPRDPDDLLQEAIKRTLAAKRTWREGITIFWHLHGAMRSIAWSWAKKATREFLANANPEWDDGSSDIFCLR